MQRPTTTISYNMSVSLGHLTMTLYHVSGCCCLLFVVSESVVFQGGGKLEWIIFCMPCSDCLIIMYVSFPSHRRGHISPGPLQGRPLQSFPLLLNRRTTFDGYVKWGQRGVRGVSRGLSEGWDIRSRVRDNKAPQVHLKNRTNDYMTKCRKLEIFGPCPKKSTQDY